MCCQCSARIRANSSAYRSCSSVLPLPKLLVIVGPEYAACGGWLYAEFVNVSVAMGQPRWTLSDLFSTVKAPLLGWSSKNTTCSTDYSAYIVELSDQGPLNSPQSTVSQAYFALHKDLKKIQNFRENFFFGTKVTSEAFLSIPQNLKVTRLQGGTHTKLWTCWQNCDLSSSFERSLGLVHGFAVLQ